MEEENVKSKNKNYGFRFALVFLLAVAMTAGLLVLWAWVSYQVRFSAEVIRAGLGLLNILPCLCGGRLLRAQGFPRLPLYGAALGGSLYAVTVALALLQGQGSVDWESVDLTAPLVYVFSGVIGTLRLGKRRERYSVLELHTPRKGA